MKKLLILLFLVASALFGQASSSTAYRIRRGSSLPATCSVGDVFFKTSATVGMYQCAVANTWSLVAGASSGIGGTIAATEVPYGSAANTLSAMAGGAWDNTTRRLSFANSASEPMIYLYGRKSGGVYASFNPDFVRAAQVATATGTNGSGWEAYGVDGGNTTIATTGTGGNGGSFFMDTGGGGQADSAVTASTGGNSGGFFFTMGAPGQATATGSGTNVGGNGGTFRIRSSTGGNAANGSSNTGGNASNLLFELGSGGDGSTAVGLDGSFLIRAGTQLNAAPFKVQSNGGAADHLSVTSAGNTALGKDLIFTLSKGQHVETQAAASDLAGTITITNPATTGAVSFTTAYANAPSCIITPTTNQIATIVTWWVTTSTTAVTANVQVTPGAAVTFHYHCIGNPN